MAVFKELEEKIIEVYGSVSVFAKVIGMKRKTIESRLENKTEFKLWEMHKIAFFLKLSMQEANELFYGIIK